MSMETYWSNHVINGLTFILTVEETRGHLLRSRRAANPVNVGLPSPFVGEEKRQSPYNAAAPSTKSFPESLS